MFLVNDVIALLAANLVLSQALGTSTLFIAASGRRKLVWTSLAITVFTTLGSAAAYFVDASLPGKYSDCKPLIYVGCVGAIYAALLSALYFASREIFLKTRKYIHVSAFNCAVMGTLYTTSEKASQDASLMNFGSYVKLGLEAGAGFVIAAFILAAAHGKLNSTKVPAPFRGFPATLVYLGIVSMAVYALK